jgi:3-dehydroquinate synthase
VVSVALAERGYEIVIGRGELARVDAVVQLWGVHVGGWPKARRAAIVTDTNVRPHADLVHEVLTGGGWRSDVLVIPAGEQSKSLEVVAGLYDRLVDIQADRRSLVVAVGGGVVGDIAGFVAATYNRGLPFLQIPTTLLADVDSSVGGKVGINHPRAKNLIGAFHQPIGVLIDLDALTTLPDREYRSGLAEVVKYGVILDEDFFTYLEAGRDALCFRDPDMLQHAIARSCRLKADVVEQDEFERTGLRAVLNYGHTFAHAFEALAGYGELLHGEAVSLGMVCASRLAERLGLIRGDVTGRQQQLLEALGLPTALPAATPWTPDDVLTCMRLDKKSLGGRLRFVLPTGLGHVRLFDDVDEADVRAVLDR